MTAPKTGIVAWYGILALFIIISTFVGIQSAEIPGGTYDIIRLDVDSEEETYNCKYKFNNVDGATTVIWTRLDTGDEVGTFDNAGVLTAGPGYGGLVKAVDSAPRTSSDASVTISIQNVTQTAIYSCAVSIQGDTPPTATKYFNVMFETKEEFWILGPPLGLFMACSGIIYGIFCIVYCAIGLNKCYHKHGKIWGIVIGGISTVLGIVGIILLAIFYEQQEQELLDAGFRCSCVGFGMSLGHLIAVVIVNTRLFKVSENFTVK